MTPNERPTWRARRLAKELRELRSKSGLSASRVAEVLLCNQPKMSQIENASRGPRPLELKHMLDLYGVTDEDYRDRLTQLLKNRTKKDWAASDGPILDDFLKDYLTIESEARLIRAYEPVVVPGLLQVPEYAKLVISFSNPAESVETLLHTRMARQEQLDDTTRQLRAVIDVPALHRIPDQVRDEQLEHLLTMTRRSNVTLQVLPLEAQMPLDQYPPYTLFSMDGEPTMDVVWMEHRTGGTMLEGANDVSAYVAAWTEMTAAALSPIDSQRYIHSLIKEKKST